MAIFECKNLKVFNKAMKPIFYDFSFKIEKSEIWMVSGPNGIGKSSLWETLIGINCPAQGKILLNNKDIISMQPADRVRLGMKYIAQNNALFEDISVFDNLMIIAESLLKSSERNSAIENAIELFDLGALIKKNPKNLSGGQKRRVELSKIVIGKSLIILLDEPFAAIDEEYTEKMLQTFSIIQKEGPSFLINDHNTQAVKSIANYSINLVAWPSDNAAKEFAHIEKINNDKKDTRLQK